METARNLFLWFHMATLVVIGTVLEDATPYNDARFSTQKVGSKCLK